MVLVFSPCWVINAFKRRTAICEGSGLGQVAMVMASALGQFVAPSGRKHHFLCAPPGATCHVHYTSKQEPTTSVGRLLLRDVVERRAVGTRLWVAGMYFNEKVRRTLVPGVEMQTQWGASGSPRAKPSTSHGPHALHQGRTRSVSL